MSALRWTRFLLLGDLLLIGLSVGVLLAAQFLGFETESLKWPTMFFGGVLLIVAGILSVAALSLQVAVGVSRRSEVR